MKLPELNCLDLPGCWIAGGAVLSTVTKQPISDFDVYPKSNKALLEAIEILMEDGYCCYISDRAITFKINETNDDGERIIYQLMTYDVFPTSEKIFENFDFSVAMGAYDCDTKKYEFTEQFWYDVASKTATINPNTRYPLNTLLRLNKYQKKGYYFPKGQLLKLSHAIIEKGFPDSWEGLEEELGGVYGQKINLLKRVNRTPPENIDDGSIKENLPELPYTEENIYMVLDELGDGEFDLEDSPDTNFSAEQLISIFSEGDIYYVDLPENHFSQKDMISQFEVTKNGYILGKIDKKFEEIISSKMKKYDGKLYGYKSLNKIDENTFESRVWRKPLTYTLGEYTTEENDPYIFVHTRKPNNFTSLSKAKNSNLCVVSFDIDDVAYISPTVNEINVKRVKLEKVIK